MRQPVYGAVMTSSSFLVTVRGILPYCLWQGPTEEDRDEALRRLLSGLGAGDDVFELTASVADLHPKHDTFPGEVFMEPAVDVLEIVEVTRNDSIPYEGLRETYLPECEFRGRDNRRIQYAILHKCIGAFRAWNLKRPIRLGACPHVQPSSWSGTVSTDGPRHRNPETCGE